MNEQQVGEVAKAAFHSSFGDVEVVRVNVRRGFDYDEDGPTVDVNIIYDGKVEQLDGQASCGCAPKSSRRYGARRKTPRLPAGSLHRQVRHRAPRPGHRLTPYCCPSPGQDEFTTIQMVERWRGRTVNETTPCTAAALRRLIRLPGAVEERDDAAQATGGISAIRSAARPAPCVWLPLAVGQPTLPLFLWRQNIEPHRNVVNCVTGR